MFIPANIWLCCFCTLRRQILIVPQQMLLINWSIYPLVRYWQPRHSTGVGKRLFEMARIRVHFRRQRKQKCVRNMLGGQRFLKQARKQQIHRGPRWYCDGKCCNKLWPSEKLLTGTAADLPLKCGLLYANKPRTPFHNLVSIYHGLSLISNTAPYKVQINYWNPYILHKSEANLRTEIILPVAVS